MEHLVERINDDYDYEAELQVIRYITTGCPKNVEKFIALGGEQALLRILGDTNGTLSTWGFACGIVANVCSVDSSLLEQQSEFLFSVDDLVSEYYQDAKMCCMGVLALFALVKDNKENLTILYWLEWDYKARFIRKFYSRSDVIYTLCAGIITMFEQLNLFWNIHAERGDTLEIIKSVFAVLNGSPSQNLAKNGLRILKDMVIESPDIFRYMVIKGVGPIFAKLRKDDECNDYINQIHSFLRNKRELDSALGIERHND